MTGGGRQELGVFPRDERIDVDSVLLVDGCVVQLVQRGVDVTVIHAPLWSVEGIGGGCLVGEGLRRTERYSGSMARWCRTKPHLFGLYAACGGVTAFPSTRATVAFGLLSSLCRVWRGRCPPWPL